MKSKIQFTLNGKAQNIEAHSMARLLDVLREELQNTGTKEGCGEGECGACSVLVNGELVNSCLLPMAQLQGAVIETIEGIRHPLQDSFVENNGAQCGICTPGMIMASLQLLRKNKNPNEEEIREALAGNLCRCTGYTKIFDSVKAACRLVEA